MKWVNYLLEKLNKQDFNTIPAGNYMLKVNNRNTRTRCEICSKLNNKVNFEQVNAGWDNRRHNEHIATNFSQNSCSNFFLELSKKIIKGDRIAPSR